MREISCSLRSQRSIKFRGLTKEGNWIYGNLIVNNIRESDGIHKAKPLKTYIREQNATWISDEFDKCWTYLTFEVIPETVGQFIGLKDKNGKEIYEGDIMVTHTGWKTVVRWDEENLCYCGFMLIWEVIGNIHENPELLKG